MVDKIKALCKKYSALIRYFIFGVVSTVVNIVTYAVCYNVLGIHNIPSNIIAWVVAVIVAFVTNKIWVFESRSTEMKILVYEILTFFGCRVGTEVIDLVVMYVGVNVMAYNNILMKCIANVIVIIVNYVASKLIIFRKKK